jgi:predicted GNAT superfamily acetyltransferase
VSAPTGSATARTLADSAWQDAERAAYAAGVVVHAAGPDDFAGVQEVISSVWGPAQRPQANLLMAMVHAGATVATAVRDGEAVGACIGFLGWTGGLHLHSHMAAVRDGARTAGAGYALKLWQRAACLEQGVVEMRWTYDPLVRRNAYFNLAKLGARVVNFLPAFYGDMDDIVNAGDRSDRFEVSWALDADPGAGMPAGLPAPVAARWFVALPDDYVALRRDDPAAAQAERERVHTATAEHWSAGLRPVWDDRGGYAFRPPGAGRDDRG